MKFARIKKFSPNIYRDLSTLHKQLSSSGKALRASDLKRALKNENTYLFGLFDGGRIVGSGTLVFIQALLAQKWWIEDVVVLYAYRGRGLGERIMRELINYALKRGAQKIDLTSSSSRMAAAHHLYEKVGFKIRDTKYYRRLNPKARKK